MSPHTPDAPGSDGRDPAPGDGTERAPGRLRRLGADLRGSVESLIDSLIAPQPTLAPVPVTPPALRRRNGGAR